jgi:hypothetical protein
MGCPRPVGSNFTKDKHFCVFSLCCPAALRRADTPIKESYPLCMRLGNWKRGQGQTEGLYSLIKKNWGWGLLDMKPLSDFMKMSLFKSCNGDEHANLCTPSFQTKESENANAFSCSTVWNVECVSMFKVWIQNKYGWIVCLLHAAVWRVDGDERCCCCPHCDRVRPPITWRVLLAASLHYLLLWVSSNIAYKL